MPFAWPRPNGQRGGAHGLGNRHGAAQHVVLRSGSDEGRDASMSFLMSATMSRSVTDTRTYLRASDRFEQ